jgi:hypothetical protein
VAPALAENGLLGSPFPNSPLRAAVSRFGSVRDRNEDGYLETQGPRPISEDRGTIQISHQNARLKYLHNKLLRSSS